MSWFQQRVNINLRIRYRCMCAMQTAWLSERNLGSQFSSGSNATVRKHTAIVVRDRYQCGEHQGVRANIHFDQIRKLLPRETTTKQSGSLRACPGVESAPRFSLPLQTCRPQLPPCKHRNRKAVTSTSSCQVRLKPAETRLRNSEYYRVPFAVRKFGRQASNGEQFPCGQRGQALKAMA